MAIIGDDAPPGAANKPQVDAADFQLVEPGTLSSELDIVTTTDVGSLIPLGNTSIVSDLLQREFQDPADDAINAMTVGPILVVADFFSTIASSFGAVDDDFLQQRLNEFAPKTAAFYANNKGGIGFTAAVAGAIIPGTLAVRAIQGTSFLGRAAQGIPLIERLFVNSARTEKLNKALRLSAKLQGRLGTRSPVDFDLRHQQLIRATKFNAVQKGLKESLAFEAAFALTQNSSDVLFPEEFTLFDNLLFAGAGIGIGVGLEVIFARKLIRGAVKETAREAAATLNPGDLPLKLVTGAPDSLDATVTILSLHMAALRNQITLAHTADGVVKAPTLVSNLNKEIQATGIQLNDLFDRIGRRSFAGITDKTALNAQQRGTLRTLLDEDPSSLAGLKYIEPYSVDRQLNFDFRAVYEDQVKQLRDQLNVNFGRLESASAKAEPIIRANIKKIREQLVVIADQQTFVARSDGLVTLEDDFARVTDLPGLRRTSITRGEGATAVTEFSVRVKAGADTIETQVDTRLELALPKDQQNKALFELSTLDISAHNLGFAAFAQYLDNIHSIGEVLTPLAISRATPLYKLDVIDTLLDSGKLFERELVFAKDLGREDLKMLIIQKKFDAFNQLKDQRTALEIGAKRLNVPPSAFSDSEIAYRLNLPTARFGELSPMHLFFEQERLVGRKNFDSFSINELMEQVSASSTFLDEAVDFFDQSIQFRGNTFTAPLTAEGEFLQPMLVLRKNLEPQTVTKTALAEDLLARRAEIIEVLSSRLNPNVPVGSVENSLVGNVTAMTVKNPAAAIAADVDLLHQSALSGSGFTLTGRQQARDVEVLQAIGDIGTLAEKQARSFSGSMFAANNKRLAEQGENITHEAVLNKLLQKDNSLDLFDLERFVQARRFGWDLDEAAIQLPNGRWEFTLDHGSNFNKKRFKEIFGFRAELPKGTRMPSADSVTITDLNAGTASLNVSELAFRGIEALRDSGSRLLDERNLLFRALGLPEINKKAFHVPPPNLSGKHVTWIISPSEGVDALKRPIIGNTAKDLELRKASPEVRKFMQENPNAHFLDQDAVKLFSIAEERAFYELRDFSDPVRSRGAPTSGALSSPVTTSGQETLRQVTQALNNEVNNITRQTLQLLFEGPLSYAQRANLVLKANDETVRTIFDQYLDTLLSTSPLRRDPTVGKFYTQIETMADRTLEGLWESTQRFGVKEGLIRSVHRAVNPGFEQKEFKKFKDSLGDFFPFSNTTEFIESSFRVRPPTPVRQHLAGLNFLTSTLTLRLFELGHPLLNLSGVVATMPAVISALKRGSTENITEWQARIGAFGSIIPLDKPIGVLNSVRLMASAAHMPFTAEGRAVLETAKRFGLIRQEVAEIHRTIGQIKGKSDLRILAERATEFASTASDRSEDMARAWAHLAGAKIGKQIGLTDDLPLHTFAHRFANEVIGDYRASNRPLIFQGAAGMPLGLFQTYIWNYYQRLFRYIESRDVRSAAVQFGMQAAVFGGVTIPGYQVFNSMFIQAQDGKQTPVDAIQSAYGPATADMIMFGTFSNIPKLFGGDGISLFTRGDTTPRIPVIEGVENVPVVNMANNFYQMLAKSIGQIMGEGGTGFDTQKQLELIGTYFQNRPIRGLAEVFAGVSVDRRANLIEEDVRTGIGIAARIFGLRPLGSEKRREALRRVRTTEISQQAHRARLREGLKSAFRSGSLDADLLTDAIQNYVVQGGSADNFPNFIKQTFVSAVTPQDKVKLREMFRRGDLDQSLRLLNAGVNLGAGDENFKFSD